MRRVQKYANPEHKLQVSVKQYLVWCAPSNLEWTSSQAGAHLGQLQRVKAKAAGLRPGFPDLMFILPGGSVKFIELKAPGGSLSEDQKRIRDALHPNDWALCRTLDEVIGILRGWGVAFRDHPFDSASIIEEVA